MMPSQCPRIATEVVQTGRQVEAEFRTVPDGRPWVRAYFVGSSAPMVESRADGRGLSLEQANILSIALQMAIDWSRAEEARRRSEAERLEVTPTQG